jgi:hypothetical protein
LGTLAFLAYPSHEQTSRGEEAPMAIKVFELDERGNCAIKG